MLQNPNFEQNVCSKTAEDIYKIGQDSTRLMNWLINFIMITKTTLIYWVLFINIIVITYNHSYIIIVYYYDCMKNLSYF